jgi:hypothetical protein
MNGFIGRAGSCEEKFPALTGYELKQFPHHLNRATLLQQVAEWSKKPP